MEVRFTGLAPTERVLNLAEEDLAEVYDLLADYLLSMIPFMELGTPGRYQPHPQKQIIELCKKYDIPHDHPASVATFFRAVLGRPDEQGDSDSRPKLAIAK